MKKLIVLAVLLSTLAILIFGLATEYRGVIGFTVSPAHTMPQNPPHTA